MSDFDTVVADHAPIEAAIRAIRVRLEELTLVRQVDGDGVLAELWRVLQQKRGSRR